MIQTLTELGSQLLADALSSEESVEFTRCAVGTGSFDPEEDDPSEMEELIARAAYIPVTAVRREDGGLAVVADMDNTTVAGGTEISEFGVYAQAESSDEVLFSYAYTDEPEVVPASSESTYERRFLSHFVLSDEEAELAIVYDSIAEAMEQAGYITADDVQTAINAALTSVFRYKGVKSSAAELPATGNKVGDVWFVSSDNSEYAWNGERWEQLGSANGAPASPTGMVAEATGKTTIRIKWSDPEEMTYSNGAYSVWKATALVRKTGSTPQSPSDGTLVTMSTTHDAYATSGYQDTGLENGTTYFYAAFPISAGGAIGVAATSSATPSWSAVSWANSSFSDIVSMIEAHYSGEISLSDYWSVGDTRTVPLSAMEATGVGESHVAQDVEVVLMDFDHYDLTSAQKTALGTSKTKAAVVWGLKNFLSNGTAGEYGYMESTNTNANGWHGSARRTWCQNVFKAALPSAMQSLLKEVSIVTATKGNARGTTASSDYIFLPAEKEVFGTNTYANSTDEASLSQYEWYETAENRIKKAGAEGSAHGWWERSPYGSNTTSFCGVTSDGTASRGTASANLGVAPCGCF